MAITMTWRTLAALALLASGGAAKAAEPLILSITIVNAAAKSVYEGVYCDGLRIDEKRVRYFLRHAKPSIEHNYSQAYETHNCSASAIVRYRSGPPMTLTVDDGTGWGMAQRNKSVTYLYCERCENLLDAGFDFK